MLRDEDQHAIEDLFERLRRVEKNSGPRDHDAENLIHQRLSEHPGAAYYMAQTIIVQEAALRDQQAKIEALEADAKRGSSGFLGSIFGEDPEERRSPPTPTQRQRGPWDRPASGGFLAGAAQTALGVTGGVLLGSAIAGMFSDPVQAAEAPEEPPVDEGFDGGEDWGGFDIGGDF